MTPADQAILFQCQKWHIDRARQCHDLSVEWLKRSTLKTWTDRLGRPAIMSARRKALSERRNHILFASALTAVVSQPVQPSPP